jgi:hypothetical protein
MADYLFLYAKNMSDEPEEEKLALPLTERGLMQI